jgi:hypothetical protein
MITRPAIARRLTRWVRLIAVFAAAMELEYAAP